MSGWGFDDAVVWDANKGWDWSVPGNDLMGDEILARELLLLDEAEDG